MAVAAAGMVAGRLLAKPTGMGYSPDCFVIDVKTTDTVLDVRRVVAKLFGGTASSDDIVDSYQLSVEQGAVHVKSNLTRSRAPFPLDSDGNTQKMVDILDATALTQSLVANEKIIDLAVSRILRVGSSASAAYEAALKSRSVSAPAALPQPGPSAPPSASASADAVAAAAAPKPGPAAAPSGGAAEK